jgi:DNA (cytosine-5)-methyltransferase 1
LAGKHLAEEDGRNQFPATLRIFRQTRPAVALLENVPGLSRTSFRPYLEYIVRQLRYPAIKPRHGELWQDHDVRLRAAERGRTAPEYHAEWWLLNAADYGVPQARVRVVFIATRADLRPVERPKPTHSRAALMKAQLDGIYWAERGLVPRVRLEWPKRVNGKGPTQSDGYKPWVTVRDSLAGLPEPGIDDDHHFIVPGARLYEHHSGSEMDWPAKTIKAGVHGVAGGENVLLLDDDHRYFTLREMARLQGFPDSYRFSGPRSRVIGQIGNAVPIGLAQAIGLEIRKVLTHL